ncbi:capsid protein [Rhizobium leguminosarum]|nr:capsid protein [Rhizobium leguminosarum]
MSGQPFPVNPVLTGILMAYQNGEYIADQVLPRMNPRLAQSKFSWWKFDFSQQTTIQDTKVGRKSEPNTVEFSASEQQDATDDYGLDDIVPNDDIANAPPGYDPEAVAAERTYDLVLLDREKRVADKVFAAGTYPVGNKEVLAGASKWNNAASTPIAAVAAAKDSMVMQPNVMVIGRTAFTALRTNPQILRAINPSGIGDGMASKRAIADLLEFDDIIVGTTWLNSAKPGQAPQRIRLWGAHCALLRLDKLAGSDGKRATFGWTAQFGTPVSGSISEPKTGLRGSQRVRAGESLKEVISASELGYFFQDVA